MLNKINFKNMERAKFLVIPMAFVASLATAQVTAFHTTNLGLEDPVIGTARYTGMAGAMGALGGNSSSVKDNPAGLATSTLSDVGLTFNVHSDSEGKCSFNMNDASAVFNFNHHSSGYISSALSISYNRIRNYAHRLYRYGTINYTDLDAEGKLIGTSTGSFSDEGIEKGGSGEVNFAYAGNINNMVYFGFSLGITSMHYNQRSIYQKVSLDQANIDDWDRNWLYPDDFYRETDGFGVNFKVGLIAQPTDFMRIGASIQTPSKYNCNEYWEFYQENMDEQGNSVNALTDSEYNYELHLPFKFNAGIGFMINDRVNLGIDYSMKNFSKTWVEMNGVENRPLEEDIENLGTRQSTLKIGAECNIIDGLDVRAGYALTTAPMKDADEMKAYAQRVGGLYLDADANTGFVPNYGVTMTGKTHYVTAGIGYTGKVGYVDFAYVRRLANEQYFEAIPGAAVDFPSLKVEDTKRGSNDFMLTLGLRF
mgnify:CR=1 FL=1